MMIGESIKKYRLKRKFTLAQLAGRARFTASYIHCLENDKRSANIDVLERIFNALGVEIIFKVKEIKQ